MRFGGLQKCSLIDYPGKISCVFFLSGCNFDCPYCHNASLARDALDCPEVLEGTGAYDFLERRRGFIDGVVVSGGEPTLQKDLAGFCEKIKELGFPVKLDTNGSMPGKIKSLIDQGLVDYVAMDIKTDPFHYDPIIRRAHNPDDILLSIQIIMESAQAYEFRTTCVKGFVDEHVIYTIAQIIKGAKRYVLQAFQCENVLHPEFFQNVDYYYDNNDLLQLKSIADPYVEECIIR